MQQPFRDFEMCCPHCGSNNFIKTPKSFSPFSRWTCQNCEGTFFRSKRVQLMTEKIINVRAGGVRSTVEHKKSRW